MKKILLNIIGISLTLAATHPALCTTITASNSGKWDDKNTWTGSKIPQCGDSIVIGLGKTIDVGANVDFSTCGNAMSFVISGTLNIQGGKKIILACGSKVMIKDGGTIITPASSTISNSIEICSATAWDNTKGNITGPTTLEQKPKATELVHFSAKPGTDGIQLSWTTASETNPSDFIIEKSKDGNKFSEIGKVKCNTNSTTLSNYKFIDKDPTAGLQFYRLTKKNQNGEITNMDPITIRWNHNPDFTVYPNPSKGELFANIANSLKKKIGLLMITNNKGSVVVSKDIVFSDKTKSLSLLKPAEHLSPGEYEVNVICQGNLYSQQVTVE